MSALSIADKRRIAARIFFQDNQGGEDGYEDYHEALAEFISGENQSDQFIEFVVKPYLKPKEGHTLIMRDDGHVASVRDEDGYFEPLTEMTQNEGEAFHEEYLKAADEYPDIEGYELLAKIRWKVIN